MSELLTQSAVATILGVTGRTDEVVPFVNAVCPELEKHFSVVHIPFGGEAFQRDVDLLAGNRIIDRTMNGVDGEHILFMASGVSTLRQVAMLSTHIPYILGRDVIRRVLFVHMDSTNPARLRKASDPWPVLYCDLTDDSLHRIIHEIQ